MKLKTARTASPIRLFVALVFAAALVATSTSAQYPASGHRHSDRCHHDAAWPMASDGDDGAAPAAEGEEKKDEKKEEKWDVANPPGDWADVKIDVREGTWMNLDVSPDGKEIVFDLLGDLFLMPIEGGEAKALTSGIPWDMQPRFSPDGKEIAFTSDRGGGDNIWVMPKSGGEAKAVTSESFRLLNNPVWSPDGRFIAARKHFTARRSLGSGEIWLYHRSGGDGVQLNAKPNDQKDLGEPAFSPDGKYVYFSQDSTPGAIFQYNKDPNGQIYTISRIDLMKGETERVIEGAGGAVRPTPSPDGKSLAFVRRDRYKTALYVRDLQSGEDRKLFDGLERDLQETWAVHGVYSNFAWTPDNKAIVFWAGGTLHRIDVKSQVVADIPFHVVKDMKVAPALRRRIEVSPQAFEAKMIRWPQVAPDGKKMVFQALGYLWLRDLPDGKPRRLTSQDERFEIYPSWSRDSRSIVYATWNDAELGDIRITQLAAPTGTNPTRIITKDPGHYVEPVLSPNGEQVVFRKSQGGFITSPLWSREPGLYVVPAAGGKGAKVADHGVLPHFGASSDRVFFLDFGDEDRRSLKSIELSGKDEYTHAGSEAATDFRVSPDGRWVAFQERFQVFVMPFAFTSKPLDIGPKAGGLPVKRVSKDAGDYLGWSGDSKTLYWSFGDQLMSRKLEETFAFLPGAPEKLPEAPEKGIKLGLAVKTDVPDSKLALVGARLITMKGDEVIEEGTVLVEGNKIVAIGNKNEVAVPKGYKTIDVAGKTIIPGLVDVHWHGAQGTGDEIVPQQSWFNYAALTFGVTTIHDPSNDTSEFFAAAELQRAGLVVGPRLFSTGTILYGAGGDFKAVIDSVDDARAHLKRMQSAGAFSVKSYNQPRRDQRQQVVTAARELGMLVVPEGGSLFQHNMSMVVDGHTGIEHAIPLARLYDDVVQLWSQTEVGYTPTIVVGYGGIWGENYWYANTDVWANEKLQTFVPRFVLDPASRRPFKAPLEEYNHIEIAKTCKKLADKGVKVNIGAHGQREGLGAHWEMWMLEQGGMTPHQALQAGTINGAHYIGMDDQIGSLEKGKLADLAVLDKNPLENLKNSETVSHVMVNGRLFDAKTMNEIGSREKARKPFFWEKKPVKK